MTTQRVNPVRGLLLVLMMLVGPTVFASDIYSTAAYREKCGGDVFPACNSWFASTGLNQWSMFDHAVLTAYLQRKLVLVVTGKHGLSYTTAHYLQFVTVIRGGSKELVEYADKNFIVVPIDVTKNGSRDVTKHLQIPHDEDQLVIYDPVQNRVINFVRSLLYFGSYVDANCDYTSDGKRERQHSLLDLRLSLLKNPTSDYREERANFRAQANKECLEGMLKYFHGLKQETKN